MNFTPINLLFVVGVLVVLLVCEINASGEVSDVSDEMRKGIKLTFNKFDKDGDGLLSLEELKSLFEVTGRRTLSVEDVKRAMTNIPKNGNGEIDFDGFFKWTQNNNEINDEQIRITFNIIDKDENGYIDERELKEYMSSIGQPLSDEDFNEIMEADTDGDGKLSFEEYKNT